MYASCCVYAITRTSSGPCIHQRGFCSVPFGRGFGIKWWPCERWVAWEEQFSCLTAVPVFDARPVLDLQVEHWKEQAGLSPEKRQMVDLADVLDERWKNPDLDQQSVYSPKPN